MQFKSVVVLTVDEAREHLVAHFTQFLTKNPVHLSSLLRNGKISELPNFATASPEQVMQLFRDNGVGKELFHETAIDSVLIQNGNLLEEVYKTV